MGAVISLLILIFAPDLSDDACEMILALIPSEALDSPCDCDVGIGGVIFTIELEAEASCPITVGEETCQFTVSGEGDGIDIGFAGGEGNLSFSANSCDIDGVGELAFSASGEFSADSVEVNSCSVSLVASAADTTIACTCANLGSCGEDVDDLTADVTCTSTDSSGSATELINGCVNLADLPSMLLQN